MRRILAPLVVLILAALGLSACTANAAPYAAHVDGTSISNSTLNETLTAIAGDKGLRCELATAATSTNAAGTSSSTLTIEGAGSDTFSSQFVASQLTQLIELQDLNARLESLHLMPGTAQLALATSRLEAELTPASGSACTESGTATIKGLPSAYRASLVGLEADEDTVAAHLAGVPLTSAGLQSYATAHSSVADLACVSAILVISKADAASARQAIEQGASFATVAKARSTDAESAANGGALGCIPTSDLAAPLNTDVAQLSIGQLSQPVSFSGDYVILEVTSRQAPTQLEALDALLGAEGTAEGTFIAKAIAVAHVTVDPEYGSWSKQNGVWTVVPPNGPADADLANPSALTPATVSVG